MTTPKSSKRKVIPILQHDEEEEELHASLPLASNKSNEIIIPNSEMEEDAILEKQVNENEANEDDDEEEVLSPEEEERLRIWDIFAEEYHDIIAELPLEYQRNFTLLQELEESQQASVNSLKSTLESYVTSISSSKLPSSPKASTSAAISDNGDEASNETTRAILSQIGKTTRAAIRAGEDKVGLAVTLYEAVDRHIRRLDADLAKYEDSLVIGLRAGTLPSHDAPSLSLKSPPGRTTSRGAIAFGEREAYGSQEEMTGKRRGRGGGGGSDADKKREKLELKLERRAREVQDQERDMNYDPSEPTFCYCGRVSFGQMIGCENDDCALEWFHRECLGFSEVPSGTWYCEPCKKLLGVTLIEKTSTKKGYIKKADRV